MRTFAGFALAMAISAIARRARSLTTGGAVAATIIGTITVAAGWTWGALLIIYFATSTALSHAGRERKARRTASVIAKPGARDAAQVLANGALFTGAALATIVQPHAQWVALGAGALAASAADTWATEIGTLSRGDPRTVLGWRVVPAGTSGAVSLAGSFAMLAGAMVIGILVFALGWTPRLAAVAAVGGIAGAVLDTLLGAVAQSRRWCDGCARETERDVHDCGQATRHLRGFGWLDNDLVNFASGAFGGLLAALLSR